MLEYGIIYKVTNLLNNKIYIGQTTKVLNNRKNEHYRRSVIDNVTIPFHNALRKYDKDIFKWELLCQCYSRQDLNSAEIFFIDFFKKSNYKLYNITNGGEGISGYHHTDEIKKLISKCGRGRKHTEQTKQKISITRLQRKAIISGRTPWNKGKHGIYTEEAKQRMGLHQLNKKRSKETKQKISNTLKGKYSGINHWSYGKEKKLVNTKIKINEEQLHILLTSNTITKIAKILNVTRSTIYNNIKKYNIIYNKRGGKRNQLLI